MKVLSGSSNTPFATSLAKHLKAELLPVELSQFANGEKRVWVRGDVRGENVILVQSFSHPADEHIIEFLLTADAIERMGARHIHAVIPWLGYSLQDKVFRDGEPIAAKVVANLVSGAHIKRVFLLDLHNSSTPGFFSIPSHHLSALHTFAEYAKKTWNTQDMVIASPDFGGLKRARLFADLLHVELVNIDKARDIHSGEITDMDLHGNVAEKTVLIFDDVINTGSTVEKSARELKTHGAHAVHFLSTHGIFADNGLERIAKSAIDSVIITNSIPQPAAAKIKVLDIAPVFATELGAWR
jgi:ribose-phosphate pyrophosphokinase